MARRVFRPQRFSHAIHDLDHRSHLRLAVSIVFRPKGRPNFPTSGVIRGVNAPILGAAPRRARSVALAMATRWIILTAPHSTWRLWMLPPSAIFPPPIMQPQAEGSRRR